MPSDSMLLDPGQTGCVTGLPPGSGRPSGEQTALCRMVLDQVLRSTVISRLRLAHPEPAVRKPAAPPRCVDPAEGALRLAAMLRRGTQRDVDALVEALVRAADIDTFFMDIAPAADQAVRERDDGGDQAGSALASWRLLEAIERLSPRFQAAGTGTKHGGRALLAEVELQGRRAPLQLTEECLIRDGWDVWCEPRSTPADLLAMLGREWFAMVVLEGGDAPAEQIAALVRRIRRASCNARVRVMVISAALVRRPDRMARLGADAAAADLRHACTQARRLLTLMPAFR